jgi:hypothetical protein
LNLASSIPAGELTVEVCRRVGTSQPFHQLIPLLAVGQRLGLFADGPGEVRKPLLKRGGLLNATPPVHDRVSMSWHHAVPFRIANDKSERSHVCIK